MPGGCPSIRVAIHDSALWPPAAVPPAPADVLCVRMAAALDGDEVKMSPRWPRLAADSPRRGPTAAGGTGVEQ